MILSTENIIMVVRREFLQLVIWPFTGSEARDTLAAEPSQLFWYIVA